MRQSQRRKVLEIPLQATVCNLLLEKTPVSHGSMRSSWSCAALGDEAIARGKAGEIPPVLMINSYQPLGRFNMTPAWSYSLQRVESSHMAGISSFFWVSEGMGWGRRWEHNTARENLFTPQFLWPCLLGCYFAPIMQNFRFFCGYRHWIIEGSFWCFISEAKVTCRGNSELAELSLYPSRRNRSTWM